MKKSKPASPSLSGGNPSRSPAQEAELRRLVAEQLLREKDPLLAALRQRTPRQLGFVCATQTTKCAEGANRSGKTETNILDCLLEGRGLHPTIRRQPCKPGDTWRCWYGTISFEMFGLQAWQHFKKMLLYPGESIHKLPTRNILAIGWQKKDPEQPNYVKLKDIWGGWAEFWIKSYEQGAAAFQSGGVHRVALDEECDEDIVQECVLRIVETEGHLSVSATPILGKKWLADIREQSEANHRDVYHCRLPMKENPAIKASSIEALERKFAKHPEILKLRLEGFPVALEGMIYGDDVFTPAHVCNPFSIPRDWARFRSIDYGFHNTACLWFAMSQNGDDLVLYRDYLGQDRIIAENVEEINKLSAGERYVDTLIDPATLGVEGNTGERIIDLFDTAGLTCSPAYKGEVIKGIEQVWDLLEEMTGERPRFRVFRGCENFLRERRGLRWKDARPTGDEGPLKPIKREDHCMDAWRYFVTTGCEWEPEPEPAAPPEGTMARKFWEKRKKGSK